MASAPTSLRRRLSIQSSWRVLVVVLLAAVAFVVSLIVGGGGATVVSETRAVAPFNAVELAGANVVNVRVGPSQSVAVRARPDEVDLVTTEVRHGTLVVANRPTRRGTKGPMSVSVSVPSLDSLGIPSGGSGTVSVTGIRAQSLTVTLDGSGLVNASGTATRLNVSIAGSGDAELGGLFAHDVRAAVNGEGQIVVTATRSLDASVSGNGLIRYAGDPARLTTSVTGNGAIIPG